MAIPPPKTIISIRDVAAQSGDIRLQSITFDVPESSCFALLGLPDSGKTAVVKILAGLVTPESGTGYILNYALQDAQIVRDARIGLLHQSVNWPGSLTIAELIHLAAQHHPGLTNTSNTAELIALAGLNERQHVKGDRLTAAERQLAGLITLYIHDPGVIILDSPTSGLSARERQTVLQLIARIGQGRTVFFTSTHLSDAQQIASHAAVLHHGSILTQGTVETVFSRPDTTVFNVVLLGDTHFVFDQLKNLAWVSDITATTDGKYTEWTIWLRDEADASSHLLRAVLADRGLQVVQFNQIRPRIDHFLKELEHGAALPSSTGK